MSSHLEDMRSARREPSSQWLLLIQSDIRPERGDVVAFVEGRDDICFYRPIIRRKISRDGQVQVYVQNGKSEVLNVRNYLYKKIGTGPSSSDILGRCLFFVDRDLDDLLPSPKESLQGIFDDTFITCGYSFENYLVGLEALEIVWIEIFRLDIFDHRFATTKTTFIRSYNKFIKQMLPIMGWVLCHRKHGTKLNLSSVNEKKLFRLDSDSLMPKRQVGAIKHLRTITGNSWQPKCHEVLAACRELMGTQANLGMAIRGKWLVYFFSKFMEKIAERLTQPKPRRSSGSITSGSLVECVSARIATPIPLDKFLDTRLMIGTLLV